MAIIGALLAGDESGVDGERFTLAPRTKLSYPRVRDSVPLMIGTWGRETARWAGTVADEVKIGEPRIRGRAGRPRLDRQLAER